MKNTKHEADLRKEMTTLAKQLVMALKSTVTSQEIKGIGSEAARGIRSTSERLVKAIQKAKTSGAAQDIKKQAQRVLQAGKSSGQDTTKHLRANLAKGLGHISGELQTLSKNLNKHK